MKTMAVALLSLAALGLTACSETSSERVLGVDEAALSRTEQVAKSPNLVDVAVSVNASSGEFSTLIAALVAADLVDAIAAPGQRTVFAPTDAAFAALGLNADNIATALSKEALTNILLYHVVPGRRLAEDVVESDRLRMLNRDFAWISLRDDGAYINDSKIVQTDVPASNGIIHVIDAVLLP
jgi:uncharacterized surface protein with fasciclin (FAS1) repeats